MGKKIKLYKCNALVFNEKELRFSAMATVVTEYIFANNKNAARDMFIDRYKTNIHLTVSEVNISPGLIIYKNKYNSNIEDNELLLSTDSGDKR